MIAFIKNETQVEFESGMYIKGGLQTKLNKFQLINVYVFARFGV